MLDNLFNKNRKEEKVLNEIVSRIEVNMSNNYKDAAQSAFVELQTTFSHYKESNVLGEKTLDKYEALIREYEGKLKGYTHKDQSRIGSNLVAFA